MKTSQKQIERDGIWDDNCKKDELNAKGKPTELTPNHTKSSPERERADGIKN